MRASTLPVPVSAAGADGRLREATLEGPTGIGIAWPCMSSPISALGCPYGQEIEFFNTEMTFWGQGFFWTMGVAEASPNATIPRTDNLEAYDPYLRGRHLWNQRTGADIQRAVGSPPSVGRAEPRGAIPMPPEAPQPQWRHCGRTLPGNSVEPLQRPTWRGDPENELGGFLDYVLPTHSTKRCPRCTFWTRDANPIHPIDVVRVALL